MVYEMRWERIQSQARWITIIDSKPGETENEIKNITSCSGNKTFISPGTWSLEDKLP